MPKKLQLNEDYIFQRAKEGATANQIAKELNCCQPTIGKFFKKNNLKMKCVKNFKGELPEEEIIYKYKILKLSPAKLMKEYKCSANPIYNILKKNNVEINQQKEYLSKLENEDFFEKIDTEEKAYILGMISADGCLKGGVFRLCLIDKEIIEKIAKILGWKGLIEHCPSRLNKFPNGKFFTTKETWKISICSKKLIEDCSKHGITPNKSKELSLPNISEDLMRHYIRGFYDGDGAIVADKKIERTRNGWINGYPRYKLIGLQSILTEIKDFFVEKCGVNINLNLQVCKKVKNIKLFDLEYSGYDALRIRDYLYKDATIYLKRKYDKFFSIVVPTFSGYLVRDYSKKYGFTKRSIQRWISEGRLPHIIENQLRVIPFKEGDEFAKNNQKTNIDIDQLLRLHSFGKYTKKELSVLFSISVNKVKNILNKNIRNFGFSGESPIEINYNLDI